MTRFTPPKVAWIPVLALTATAWGGVEAPSAQAQELPWLRRGRVSLDFAPSFWTWDFRYGLAPDGAKAVEPLGMDLTASPLGSDVLPQLRDLEANLARALNDPSYRVRLGVSNALVDQGVLTFPFRLEVGLTDWLTLGAMVPLVRPRSEILFSLEADSISADVGPSPYATDPGTVARFLEDFRLTVEAAGAAHPGDPAVSQAEAYLEALSLAYSQATVFPVSKSAAGTQLQARLDALRASLGALGFPGVPGSLPLASGYFDAESFGAFLASNSMRAPPLEDWTTLWSLGDIEITAAVRLFRGGFQADSMGNLPFLRYQLGLGGLVRLGTGEQDDPNRFLDVSPGDGQMDLEGSVFGVVEMGRRLGAWGRLRYGMQREGEILRRIAAPGEALPNWGRLAPLLRTPGNYLELDLNPRFHLSPNLTLGVRYHSWSKGEDAYALQPIDPEILERLDYPPAGLLNQETEESLQEVGFSATYSSVEAFDRGEASLPVHLRATYFQSIAGSGGQTPKGGRFEAGITLYRSFWGRKAPIPPDPETPGR